MSEVVAELRADCSRCVGLCCVAPAFSKGSEFAIDKPAGVACLNLEADFRCSIHTSLRDQGFRGCTVFDCFGAGQQVTQVTYGGAHWRDVPEMLDAFLVMRDLHEMRWYLWRAETLVEPGQLRDQVVAVRQELETEADSEAGALLATDTDWYRQQVGRLLDEVSSLVRGPGRADHAGADLAGRSFVGSDLRGASFRGSQLIGADLRDADLDRADLLGADLRGADVRGTALAGALFLSQFQVNAVGGDDRTTLPVDLDRPAHWT
ncbi:pentapeptide repeat-containing protein [Nocardioides speluncae]|uniref:pentapeptide repeat-containing protein n=1 Tax=Nocardioides speluncae TaxID=2670337 RepID=UPI001F0BF18A|nr:pentapeptide repeat-containing protein [Nocardioides speluncae]